MAEKVVRCRHCGNLIRPCHCGAGRGAPVHWQNESAPLGVGDRHCPGEPHQLHEPEVADG